MYGSPRLALADVSFALALGIHGFKRYKLAGFGGIHVPKPFKFIGFGGIHAPTPYKFTGAPKSHLPSPTFLVKVPLGTQTRGLSPFRAFSATVGEGCFRTCLGAPVL